MPTIITPIPDIAMAERPTVAARLLADRRKMSIDPAVMAMPRTMNDAFIRPCSGEHTGLEFQVPQAVLPRSLMVSRARL
jgi:hypothetical protein